MKKHPAPKTRTPRRRTLPDTRIVATDRNRNCHTWCNPSAGFRAWIDGIALHDAAPTDFQAIVSLDALGGPYLWIGIDPKPKDQHRTVSDIRATNVCYLTISGKALREMATAILKYDAHARQYEADLDRDLDRRRAKGGAK